MIGRSPVCLKCKHLRTNPKGKMGFYCDAFPDGEGIPDRVIMGGDKHGQPIVGDHGIRFEPKGKK